MSFLNSLRQKLAFIFFLVMAAAFSFIWFLVVPQLEQNLKEERIDNLVEEARAARPALEAENLRGRAPSPEEWGARIRAASEATDARVTVRYWQREPTPEQNPDFYPLDDSDEVVPFDEALARRAIETRRVQQRFGTFRDEEVGLVAQRIRSPNRRPRVAVYSQDLNDVQQTVAFVRNRVLIATGGALLIALLGGYLVAARLARRAGRLERAARHVAHGRFLEPLPVTRRTSWGSSRTPSTRCRSSCAGWTWRARSSSPRPRTSCARRSSRWADSWSCSRTRISTRRPAASSWRR
jgi:hypothetical protein